LKVLFVAPEVRLDGKPWHYPFWAGILASVAEKKGADVGILDLNAVRMNHGGKYLSKEMIEKEISSEKWDLVGIGGLTTTYNRIKELTHLIRKSLPDTIILGGGGWSTYNADEILELVPELDAVCIGEGEETFSKFYDEVEKGSQNFENIDGLCIRTTNGIKFTNFRALISNLDEVPYPAYHLLENEIYFKYSSIPFSVESFNSKRRASVVWERGCPRGCTFCSHNGMSRIDIQNILGKGDRKKGEELARQVDKEYDTFQLPARWPTAKYAVDNVKLLHEKYQVDFITILDENMTSNKKWTEEFCELYRNEGLDKAVKWGTLGDAPSVATKPSLLKTMKDAGCTYISFGFESASNKVLDEDIQKGQTRAHLQKTIDTVREVGFAPITTFMIGNPHEDINDLMETLDFWIENNASINPFICTPYVGSPLFYNNRNFILQQYDERLKIIYNSKKEFSREYVKKLELKALDKFMTECGDATEYTATVSQYFTIPELFAIRHLMYKHDTGRLLKMAHQKFEETGLAQWNHDEKWSKYCEVCKARHEMFAEVSTINKK